MLPADKMKPLKRVTKTTLLAPIASRTRQSSQPPVITTKAPVSTNKLFETLKLRLQPQENDGRKPLPNKRSFHHTGRIRFFHERQSFFPITST